MLKTEKHSNKVKCNMKYLNKEYKKITYLHNDLLNVVELLRRLREHGVWNFNGLKFFVLTYEDIFGQHPSSCCFCPIQHHCSFCDYSTSNLSNENKDFYKSIETKTSDQFCCRYTCPNYN
uniref:Uncharacterized protein n=2 Tax=Clastoptera arizonana TaxID=38151 RepID=A0A1B6DMG3_9HEMI